MSRPGLALIHSPLVGSMTWRATAQALRALGYARVATPAACAWEVGAPRYQALARRIADQLGAGRWLLIVHSGAGGLLPALAAALTGEARGVIFVDGLLPHPGQAWLETASPALAESLRKRTLSGLVPAWPEWFGPAALATLLPDEAVRTPFVAAARPVPQAYLAEAAPLASLPAGMECAFLQLSDGYAAEAGAASALGWPVIREPLHHLAMLTRPDMVARALHRLIQTMSLSSGSEP